MNHALTELLSYYIQVFLSTSNLSLITKEDVRFILSLKFSSSNSLTDF